MPILSPQQLVDCETQSQGCVGGYPSHALSYIRDQGITTEAHYPYRNVKGGCAYNPATKAATVSTVGSVHSGPAQENTALLSYLANKGPVIVMMEMRPLQTYRGGIITSGCSSAPVDHAVVLVGYGTAAGRDYWLVRRRCVF